MFLYVYMMLGGHMFVLCPWLYVLHENVCTHTRVRAGVEVAEPTACLNLQGCTPEKMSFSFMMLTSRLVRRTAALSMICSGL